MGSGTGGAGWPRPGWRQWAGARSFTAIAEWVVDQDPVTLTMLGLTRSRPPSEPTLRRLFTTIDADQLDRILGAWTWTRTHVGAQGRRVIAIDGKTVRGARDHRQPGSLAPHLVAAYDHHSGTVLGQLAVAAKSNEIPAVRLLLKGFDLDALDAFCVRVGDTRRRAVAGTVAGVAGAGYEPPVGDLAGTEPLRAPPRCPTRSRSASSGSCLLRRWSSPATSTPSARAGQGPPLSSGTAWTRGSIEVVTGGGVILAGHRREPAARCSGWPDIGLELRGRCDG